MEQLITSDLHLGHVNIITYCDRPFGHAKARQAAGRVPAVLPEAVSEMNEWIVQMWNEAVRPDQIVYIVGDVCMGRIDDTLPIAGRLHGRKRLIVGNHDRCAPFLPKYHPEWSTRYVETGKFEAIYTQPQRLDFGRGHRDVLTWHFPYRGDSQNEDRYSTQRPTDAGEWLVHGHVHDEWRQRGRQINVGLDAWGGRVLAFDEVADLMDAGPRDLARIPWSDPVTAGAAR